MFITQGFLSDFTCAVQQSSYPRNSFSKTPKGKNYLHYQTLNLQLLFQRKFVIQHYCYEDTSEIF